jgi:hypothetical protein
MCLKAVISDEKSKGLVGRSWTLTCNELGIKNIGLTGDFKASKKDAEGYIKDKLKTRIRYYEKILASM